MSVCPSQNHLLSSLVELSRLSHCTARRTRVVYHPPRFHSGIQVKKFSNMNLSYTKMGDASGEEAPAKPDSRPVFFFDIDNCLYSKSLKIHDHMSKLLDKYFMEHLQLTEADAFKLHQEYYKTYGLAIEGLVRHHKIDPLEYNRKVDDAIPLDSIIFPSPSLRTLLEDIDVSKVKLWLFTNAYKTHGNRVVKLLQVDDLFEGMTYCDYAQDPIICKPHEKMFGKAMEEAGVREMGECYFVDDSALNCSAAMKLGWNAVHRLEDGETLPEKQACKFQIRHLEELRNVFPQFFKSRANAEASNL